MEKSTISATGDMAVRRAGRPYAGALLVLFLSLAVFLPLDRWMVAPNAVERVNLVTVAEMHRDGSWLVPTLNDVPRLSKPPLPAWLSALTVQPQTVADMANPQDVVRERAREALANEARVPSIIAACLTLVAIFDFGFTLGGPMLGLLAAAITATTVMFRSQELIATTDIYLALWVAVANAFLVRMVFNRTGWLNSLGAGCALGLALMSKGPVALIETVLPLAFFLCWRRWRSGPIARTDAGRSPTAPIATATAVMLIVGCWWYALAFARIGGQTSRLWVSEVFQSEIITPINTPWYRYALSLRSLLPWLPWLVVGVIATGSSKKDDSRGRLPVFLVLTPVLIMTFVTRKDDRYLLPMLGPAAVIAGQGLMAWAADRPRTSPRGRILLGVHWLVFLLWGLSIAQEIHSWKIAPAVMAAAVCAVLGVGGWLASNFSPRLLVPLTVALTLGINLDYNAAKRRHPEPASAQMQMADLIWRDYPQARVCVVFPNKLNEMYLSAVDLSLYLGRTVGPWTGHSTASPNQEELVYLESPEAAAPTSWQEVCSIQDGPTVCRLFLVPAESGATNGR
jgi:4-amino-4-deoxy-L-arabinose transferase-like glycosyltransferase